MVAGLHVGDTLANRLDNTSSLVSQDDGESTLGVLAREGVGIYTCSYTGVVDLHADLVSLGRSNFDILNAQLLAGLPGNSSLAGDGLFTLRGQLSSVRLSSIANCGGAYHGGAKLLTLPTVEAIVLVRR